VPPLPPRALAALDAFAFSSALVACAAAALAAAAGRAMGLAPNGAVLVLAFAGTIVVYCADRLRDLARDRTTAPRRSAFVARHRLALCAFAGLAAAAALAAGLAAGVRVLPVAALGAAFGFAHRRLKAFVWLKPFYITGAWTAVCVGLPWAASGRTPPGA